MQVQNSFDILIAEDDFMVSESIQKEVEALGHTVIGKAPDGRRAVEMTISMKSQTTMPPKSRNRS